MTTSMTGNLIMSIESIRAQERAARAAVNPVQIETGIDDFLRDLKRLTPRAKGDEGFPAEGFHASAPIVAKMRRRGRKFSRGRTLC